ncbi:MAG: STAS domain-containing protein [Planctomycetaceae bacterium]
MQHDLVLRAEPARDGVATLHLAGVIDAHTLDRFESSLAQAAASGVRSLLLDCDELHYVNSAGFGELIRYSDRFNEKGGSLVLARVPPKVGVILEMLGLKSVIPIHASLEEARAEASRALPLVPAPAALPAPLPGPPRPVAPAARAPVNEIVADERVVVCACCDARMRVGGQGRWLCAACGAPFSLTKEGGVTFDWSRSDADGIHLTLEVTPRNLAGLAGLIEGILMERRVPHARMRRLSREAAHVCHLVATHAFGDAARGPLHLLALSGPQRLHVRVVERGRALGEEAARVFAGQSRLFLDFRYTSLPSGVNVTEFAFAYAGAGVFVA